MITLRAIQENGNLRVVLKKENQTHASYGSEPAPLETIEAQCAKIFDMLNRTSRRGIGDAEALRELRDLGRSLSDRLLTSPVKTGLRRTDETCLVLECDDNLVHIPWELLVVEDRFLCQRFGMGRIVETRQAAEDKVERKLDDVLDMWILANPEGALPEAVTEGMEICDSIDWANRERRDGKGRRIVNAFLETGADTSLEKTREKLRNYDIVHFAGHADYDSDNPNRCGWKFADGVFNADQVKTMAGGSAFPLLVFSNSCQSARVEKWNRKGCSDNDPFGLANAFALVGVKHYIGSLWEIRDESSNFFARQFYGHLIRGETIGEAMRLARQAEGSEETDICRASYILYGDPSSRYFPEAEDREFRPAFEKSPVPAHGPGELKKRIYGANSATRSQKEGKSVPVESPTTKEPGRKLSTAVRAAIFFLLLATAVAIFVPRFLSSETPVDQWSSRPLHMTVVFDRNGLDHPLQDAVSAAIEKKIMDYPRIKLVDRMTLEMTLEEMKLNQGPWIDPQKKLQSGRGLPANFRLLVEADAAPATGAEVRMRLIDNETACYIDVFHQKFDAQSGIMEQKDCIAAELIDRLKSLYPLRGKITQTSGDTFALDIGSDVGVETGSRFRLAKDEKTMLKVVSVRKNTCLVQLEEGGETPKTGDRLEFFRSVDTSETSGFGKFRQ